MKVKIDTREKFHVITIDETVLAANMTEKMDNCLIPLLDTNVKSAIINIKDIQKIDNAAAEHLINIQNRFYSDNASFVIFGLQHGVRKDLEEAGLADLMNTTPTESEASDIVLMEELEREMLG